MTPPEWEWHQEALSHCVAHSGGSSWWEWGDGSCLCCWWWPVIWRKEARDGAIGFHARKLPPRLKLPQAPVTDPGAQGLIKDKLRKLLRHRRLLTGPALRATPLLAAPKTQNDIRVVWGLRKNEVNDTMCTPAFQLPTPASYHRVAEAGMEAGGFDIGEQFPNYVSHPVERPYFGVDIPEDLLKELAEEFAKRGAGLLSGSCAGAGSRLVGNRHLTLL